MASVFRQRWRKAKAKTAPPSRRARISKQRGTASAEAGSEVLLELLAAAISSQQGPVPVAPVTDRSLLSGMILGRDLSRGRLADPLAVCIGQVGRALLDRSKSKQFEIR